MESKSHNLIKENIQKTLFLEGNSLIELSQSVTDVMATAILTIYENTGRLIITGIGKSAIIAQKMVSTLNSTGTYAIYMHAADAIHGDLGMIKEDDIVLCISKSGDTPEIKVLVSLIKSFGNILMAIVAKDQSYLGINSDYNFITPMDLEADPNNLAPTTSTTLQMAMGDAIAIALLSLRGFSQQEFAKFHPGGSLGKQLYLRVSELVAQNEKPKVYLSDNIRQVILEISSKRLGATAVVDDNENLMGIVTDGDLRRMLGTEDSVAHLTAEDILSKNPKVIQKDSLAIDALHMMRKHSITQLIVVDNFRYFGMLHLHELIKEGLV